MVYPEIDKDKCVNCEMCEKVCHLNAPVSRLEDQRAYAVSHPDKDVLNRSTSGGAFTAIAGYVLSQGGAVFGCAYTGRLIPRHVCVESEQDLVCLNGSKYVESEIGDTYKQAKDMLDRGRMVLYSGTPCQIAGLKTFLTKKYDNLITVDIVCHGVAPQTYFKQYVDWLEDKYKIDITNYDFRSKRNSGWSLAGIMEGTSQKSAKSVEKKIFYFNEYYYYHFLKGTIYRDSCYSCKYANLNRPADFSLGDLWGAEALNLGYPIDKGCSLVLANNERANAILQSLDINKTEIPVEFAVKYNKQLQHASERPAGRDEALEKFSTCSAKEIDAWFRRKTVSARLKGRIKYIIPKSASRLLLKIKYKK